MVTMQTDESWALLGVPTSAAAHWPGLEQGPAAWRSAGIAERLREAGIRLVDLGDQPIERWAARRDDQRPNNWRAAVDVVARTRTAVSEAINRGLRPVILGGDCTLANALVAAAVEHHDEVGLLYVDGGQDLMIPVDHPREPILDGMGVAHLLDLPGCLDELAGLGPRRPLLRPADVAFVGYADDEEDVHGLVDEATRLPAAEVVADPVGAARRALAALPHEKLVVHLDADVLDALLLPLADVPTYGSGLSVDHLEQLLGALLADRRVVGMTVVEANPDHDPTGESLWRLAVGLGRAFGQARTRTSEH